jgi:hypothetical protein
VTEIKKITKCVRCGIQTFCKNGVCALCRAGITKMYDDLTRENKSDRVSTCKKKDIKRFSDLKKLLKKRAGPAILRSKKTA